MSEFSQPLRWSYWTNWKRPTKRTQGREWKKSIFWSCTLTALVVLLWTRKTGTRWSWGRLSIVNSGIDWFSGLQLEILNSWCDLNLTLQGLGDPDNKLAQEKALARRAMNVAFTRVQMCRCQSLTFLAFPQTRSCISYVMIWTHTNSREMGFVSYPVILFSLPIILCTWSWWLHKFQILLFGHS